MQNLDTHKIIESFIARGIPKEQAEMFVEANIIIAKAQFDNFEKDYLNLVTKNDLILAVTKLENSIELRDTRLEGSLERMSNKLLMWMLSFFGTTFLSIMALIITVLFNKG